MLEHHPRRQTKRKIPTNRQTLVKLRPVKRPHSIAPWFTETPLTKPVLDKPEMQEKILSLTPLKRIAKASEVASAVAFLAMPASKYVTGIVLPVDGGYLAQGGL